MQLLVIDDDADVRDLLRRALERDGHVVALASSVGEAEAALAERPTDLVVLDLGLPDGSGLELCRSMRACGEAVPILILTARSQVALRVEGLDAGADDFLSKPFAVAELRARVRALARRGPLPRALRLERGGDVLDVGARRAWRGGRAVALTAREWAILELLASRSGRVVSRGDILIGVWGEATGSTNASLEVLVGRIRRKLGGDVIRTLRGEGYALAW